MYDYTIDEIIKKIEDPEEYFDPKLFIHLLEIHFNCNIFLFSRENNGQIIIPRNMQCYYKMKNKNRCIFIFEHLGSRADDATYPQCELIIKQINEFRKDTENIFNFFHSTNTFSRLILFRKDKIKVYLNQYKNF